MESYEMTGTPRQVIEDIRTTFDMTELEAELVALGALYNQDNDGEDETAVRNFIVSMEGTRATATIRNVPVTIRLNGIPSDILRTCIRNLVMGAAVAGVSGTLSVEDVSVKRLLAKIVEAFLEVMYQHTAWLETDLMQRDAFVALLDYVGNEAKKEKSGSIYRVLFTLEDIREQMKRNNPENENVGRDLEGEFKRFEEKHLIEQVAETEKVKADGTKEMIYKIVF